MGFPELTKYALASVILWGLSIGLLVIISIFYIVQSRQLVVKVSGRNVLGGLGIGMCLLGIGWIVSLVFVVRDAHNIWADASSLYVSRNNLLLNWFNPITAPTGTWPANGIDPPTNAAVPIYAFPPKDGVAVCFSTWGDNRDNGFNKYRELISYYNGKGNTIKQAYFKPADPPVHPQHYVTVEEDTLENQRALTLAYYRFIYCTQKYMSMIYNKQITPENQDFNFLEPQTRNNLIMGVGCTMENANIADTKFCLDSDWPTKSNKCVAKNPCFAALTESIAAQCLLYDDLVFKTQNPNGSAAGALEAFGVIGSANKPPGIQVWDGISP